MFDELDAVRQAILNEDEGAAFYAMAAEKTEDETLKDAFSHLKDEELHHGKALRSLYERLVTRKATSDLEWGTVGEITFNRESEMRKVGKSPGLFAHSDSKFKVAITDMAVFAAGALMEQASIDFYKKASSESKSEEIKNLFDALVSWENFHLNELKSIHEALVNDFMDQQEFTHSPRL